MPGEQPQNQFYGQQEQQELKDLVEKAKTDPSSIDPDQLEKQYLDQLRQAAGSRRLDDKAFRDYQRAAVQIKEAVGKLRQIRNFFADRLKVDVIEQAAITRQSGGRIDYARRIREEAGELPVNAYTRQMVMSWDFVFLNKFINQPYTDVPEEIKATMLLAKGKAIEARRNLALAISDQYKEIFPAQLNRVERQMSLLLSRAEDKLTTITLLEYVDLENDLDELAGYLKDRQNLLASEGKAGSGGPAFNLLREPDLQSRCDSAAERLKGLFATLAEGKKYMSREDRFAVENHEKANRAVDRGDRGAREWQRAAFDRRVMVITRQQAERNALEAFALGVKGDEYKNARDKMAAADRVAARNIEQATKLYAEANEMFKQARLAYLEGQKPKPRPPGRPPRGRDQRLARR